MKRTALIGWGVGSFSSAALVSAIGLLHLRFMTDSLGLSIGLAGALVIISRVYDTVLDPIVGVLSDRTRTRFGRYRPYLAGGGLLAALSMILLFNVPYGLKGGALIAFVTGSLILFSTAYTLFRIPYLALGRSITQEFSERSKLMTFSVYGSSLGSLAATSAAPFLLSQIGSDRAGHGVIAFILAALVGTVPARKPPFPLEDDVGRPIDPPPPGYYKINGRSGPGLPVTMETERGGWVTSEAAVDRKGVRFKGPGPAPANPLPWGDSDSGRVVTQGLIPPVKPLLHLHLRDTIICLGGDGNYYMTGSTGDDIWKTTDGIELWRSPDLKRWTYLGLIWSMERDGGWEKQWTIRKGDYFRAVWAPEIHFINGNYYICLCVSRSGISILRSTTGKAEGPYVHAFSPDKPLRNGIDATLFGDDDGAVYLTYGGAFEMVRLKPDLSGYDGEWTPVTLDTPDLDPAHHNKKCVRHGYKDIGFEGATMFKHGGQYYLGAVDRFENNRYSFALATSDKPFGPYRDRYESVPCGGGGNIFKDKEGRWWCTIFGNDDEAPFREKPGIVPARMDEKGHLVADFRPRSL